MQKIGMTGVDGEGTGTGRSALINVDYVGRDGVRDAGTGVPRCDKCDAAADAGHGMGKMRRGTEGCWWCARTPRTMKMAGF